MTRDQQLSNTLLHPLSRVQKGDIVVHCRKTTSTVTHTFGIVASRVFCNRFRVKKLDTLPDNRVPERILFGRTIRAVQPDLDSKEDASLRSLYVYTSGESVRRSVRRTPRTFGWGVYCKDQIYVDEYA
jgi:hypothetical protein